MDKLKNLFTEEIEEEVEVKEEPIKKEMIQVEIPSPAQRRTEIEPKPEPTPEKEESKKEEFVFPFFDDEDFHEIEKTKSAPPKPREEPRKRAEKKRLEKFIAQLKKRKKSLNQHQSTNQYLVIWIKTSKKKILKANVKGQGVIINQRKQP